MMRTALQYLLSAVFIAQMYLAMPLMALWYTPIVMFRRETAYDAVRAYCRYVRWSAARIVGLRSEIRGEVPRDECLIAAKHQSFFDIIMIVSAVPRPKFVMKRELLRAPILGWYAMKIGCVPIDRSGRGVAQKMLADVRSGAALPGQLVIFPQGTRVAAGARESYKGGVALLARQTGQACVPAATNVGVFWPRRGILRRPGLAVVEFLPALGPEMRPKDFMELLEQRIETASDALMAEAGFVLPPPVVAGKGTQHGTVPPEHESAADRAAPAQIETAQADETRTGAGPVDAPKPDR